MSFSHWLVEKKDGFEETPLTAGLFDDRWYNMVYQTGPSIFTKRIQKDIIDGDFKQNNWPSNGLKQHNWL